MDIETPKGSADSWAARREHIGRVQQQSIANKYSGGAIPETKWLEKGSDLVRGENGSDRMLKRRNKPQMESDNETSEQYV